ncbi:MAG: hypothetical protein K2P58_15305 [Hyphomonadaceae bacterium]|nr:hypothetical protein [Hyphomonadaceae bacterium]
MIAWKYRLWRGAGVAAALGLAACGGEAGEAGRTGEAGVAGEAGEAAAPAGEAGEAAIGVAGGEHGEAGVATAYAGLAGDERTALRIEHLRGFVLIAERVASETGDVPAASALVQQGLLEVYDPAVDQFGVLDVTALRRAAQAGDRAQFLAAANQGEAALDGVAAEANHADIAARLVDVATGIYQHVNQDGAVDPIEYQHSLGAALAARQVLVAHAGEMRATNARAYTDALAEVERFVALWPSSTAPERPAAYRDVLAQSSRVRLALSPFL